MAGGIVRAGRRVIAGIGWEEGELMKLLGDGGETEWFDEKLYQSTLETKRMGRMMVVEEEVGSTQDEVGAILSKVPSSEVGSLAWTCARQVKGHGRRGNVWEGPKLGAMMTAVTQWPMKQAEKLPLIQHAAALAVCEGLMGVEGLHDAVELRIKWPNDIYARSRHATHLKGVPARGVFRAPPAVDEDGGKGVLYKVGGLLCQSTVFRPKEDAAVMIGIGINLAGAEPFADLHQLGGIELKREEVLARVLNSLEQRISHLQEHGWDDAIIEPYEALWLHTNQVVRLADGTTATIKQVSREDGTLIAQKSGREDEVVHLHPDPSADESVDLIDAITEKK